MEKAVSTFQIVVEAEQQNGGPQQKQTGIKRKPRYQFKSGTGDG